MARLALRSHAHDGGASSLQQVVDMQEESREMQQEVEFRKEGELLLEEAETALRAVELTRAGMPPCLVFVYI